MCDNVRWESFRGTMGKGVGAVEGRWIAGMELPPGEEGLDLLLSCQEEIARRRGFPEHRRKELRLALEEGVGAMVRPGAVTSYRVDFRAVPLGLEVSLHEEGEPYEVSLSPEEAPEDLLEGEGRQMGFLLLRGVTDEISFDDRGPGGRTLRFLKYLPSPGVHEIPEGAPEPEVPSLDLSRVVYRSLEPREAVEISRCAWGAYGNSYPNPHIYFPERVRALNEGGTLVSRVAVAEGRVLGHAALEIPDPREGSCELGMAFVKPPYRGLGILLELTEDLLGEATRRGFTGAFVQAVTSHPASQKAARKRGFRECALLAGAYPGTMDFRGLGGTTGQRLSFMVQYLSLGTPRERVLHVPPRHRAFLGEICRDLELPVRWGPEETGSLPSGPGVFAAEMQEVLSRGDLTVARIGRDTLGALSLRLREFRLRRAGAVVLRLPLEDPGTPALVEGLEARGCFVTGMLPEERLGDRLLLVRVFDGPLDYDRMIAGSDRGEWMVEQVRRNDPEGDPDR